MKVTMITSKVGITALLFSLGMLLNSCADTSNQQNEAKKEILTDTTGVKVETPRSSVPDAARTSQAAPEKTETGALASQEQMPKPATPGASTQKNSTSKTQEKPTEKSTGVKKTEPTPKPPAKTEPVKTSDKMSEPVPASKTEPVPAKPAPETTAPKTETTTPAPAEPAKTVEEIKKEPETKPAPAKPNTQVQSWAVPESANKKLNLVKADKESLGIGKTLYQKHCASCHGKKGLGDGPKAAQLDTPSGDFSSNAFQSQTDGSLFYKTVEGRGDMPSYKKKIPDDEDIWHLVNYMRTFK